MHQSHTTEAVGFHREPVVPGGSAQHQTHCVSKLWNSSHLGREARNSTEAPKEKASAAKKEKQVYNLFLDPNNGKLLSEQCKFCFITLSTFPGSPVALQGSGKGGLSAVSQEAGRKDIKEEGINRQGKKDVFMNILHEAFARFHSIPD